ncbi:MAG TPA: hypothetical protein VEL69_02415 [Ktedonobacteraceae bacterium]|nr:hypothetical protein [Ktedonobacteraceae bacterium]
MEGTMPWWGYALITSGSILFVFGVGGGLFVMRGLAQWMSK